MVFDIPTINRFWSKVDIRGDDECWPWMAYVEHSGYGWFDAKKYFNRNIRSHRMALMISGFMPKQGEYCLHSCDNRVCCNPKHLRWGSAMDNMQDMISRGRQFTRKFTDNNPSVDLKYHSNRKLNPPQVRYIRKLVAAGYTHQQCADWYCVTETTVGGIMRGRTFKYVV